MNVIFTVTISFAIGGACGFFFKEIIKPYWEHRLARRRGIEAVRITQKTQATASFRAAFAPALAAIDISKKVRTRKQLPSDIDVTLWNALLKQAVEIELFRPYVPEEAHTAYQEAWDKYVEEAGNYGFVATTFREDVDDPWKVFEELIHGILQFAHEK